SHRRFSPSDGSSVAPSPVTRTSSGPGRRETRTSLARSRASASVSNPGPRFAEVAGARMRSDSGEEGLLDGGEIGRDGLSAGGRADRGVRVLEPVAGEHADDALAGAEVAVRGAPAKARDRRRRCWLAEDPLLLGEHPVGVQDLVVADGSHAAA